MEHNYLSQFVCKAQFYVRTSLFTLFITTISINTLAQNDSTNVDLSGTYFLYNVDAGLFLYSPSSDGNTNLTEPWNHTGNFLFTFLLQSDGTYTIQGANNNFYLWDWSPELRSSQNPSNKNFVINKLPDGNYTLSNTRHSSNYLGWTSGEGYVSCSKNTENINWQMLDVNNIESDRFLLRKSLEGVDSLNFIDYYTLLNDSAATKQSLTKAISEIANVCSNQRTDAPVASWNEVAMTFYTDDKWWKSTSDNVAYYYSLCSSSWNPDGEATLSARVNVPEAAKLGFETYADGGWSTNLDIYIDGVKIKTIEKPALYNQYYYRNNEAREEMSGYSSMSSSNQTYNRYFVDISSGLHTIEWRYVNSSKDGKYFNLRNIGILPAPTTISVSYADAGSLGAEVLRQVNNVNDVRRLKISGPLNDDDWGRIAMMTRLVALDLSDAQITSLPAKKFDNYTALNWPFLNELKLPQILESIGDYCFRFSYVDSIDIPQSVKSIGEYAFYKSQIHEANVSSNVTTIGKGAFARCFFLHNVVYEPNMTYVPAYCFNHSNFILPFDLPSQIEKVNEYAFQSCWYFDTTLPTSLTTVANHGFSSCSSLNTELPNTIVSIGVEGFGYNYKLNSRLPESLKTIGSYAFVACALDSIDVPEGVTSIGEYAFNNCDSARYVRVPEATSSIGQYAFADCNRLQYAELPATYANIVNGYIFSGSTALKTLKLKSPTLLRGTTSTFVNGVNKSQITLQVPDYLVTAYKLDDYWYNFGGFEGFSTDEVKDWIIKYPLTLSQHDRLQGTPNVSVECVNFIIQGETGMELNKFNMDSGNNTSGYLESTQIMSSSNEVTINGELSLDYYTTSKRWFFISLPFDIRVGDLETTAQYAIAYYDGAQRAANGSASGNWKDYTADDIIAAGTGFIYQTNVDAWTRFKALETATKNQSFAARDITVGLTEYPAEQSAHTGWNLVGNPWMTYFNNHSIGFTAPFTIWNPSNSTYTAYSLIDDDYALRPNQAIFVQCPEGTTGITFPARGRQLTSVIENQNGVKAQIAPHSERRIIDLTINADGKTDQTRVVLNPLAKDGYEMECDASKFFSIERAAQLYSLGTDGTAYAINERPEADGKVRLAYVAPESGLYSISMPRCQTPRATLIDNETGTRFDLSRGDYEFQTEGGTFTNRFELSVKDIETDIATTTSHAALHIADGGIRADVKADIYGLDGRLVASGKGFIALPRGTYVVCADACKVKMVVK